MSSTPRSFLVLAGMGERFRRVGLRARLAIALGAVVVASFAFSVVDTAQHPTAPTSRPSPGPGSSPWAP